uniref:Remorin C-terminal domain-containing protein n=1 Tax=Kalanchoe fedtschenkoi TaxID=63787 RepID=A0A7N0TWE1_KALFE
MCCCFLASSRTKAENVDAWEEAEVYKIKKWNEKMKTRSHLLENEEKNRAKTSLERNNIKLEDKKGRQVLRYKLTVAKIEAIATGATQILDRKLRKQEALIKDKARKMKSMRKNQNCLFPLHLTTVTTK